MIQLKPTAASADPNDADLINRINSGDEKAFNILYYRHRDWIFRMAARLTGDAQLADDVLQEVFCYFLGKIPGFVLRCEIRTFFYPVIRNVSLNAMRKTRRYDGSPAAEIHLASLTTPHDNTGKSDEISKIVADLGAIHREVLLLRFVDGMTLPEISELTGVPLGTVKSRLHHAIAALRQTPLIRELCGKDERSGVSACSTPWNP